MQTLRRHADVRAALAWPVPPVPQDCPHRTVAWLRATVVRFSTGSAHARRRRLTVSLLSGVRPEALGRAAGERAASGDGPETIPATVLALALGVTEPVTDAVAEVAAAYQPGTGRGGDEAVGFLVDAFGGTADEPTAARIGLLVQAHAATGGLITRTVRAIERWRPDAPVEDVLAETLRYDPPVPGTRRLDATGEVVFLDFAAANRDPAVFAEPDRFDPYRSERDRHLTLGAEPRPCPGRDHAYAIAAGAVEGRIR